LIQFSRIATSDAGGEVPGGIGDAAFFIRASESSASFFVGSSFEVAFSSSSVTRLDSAEGKGGFPWQERHFCERYVATSQGNPDGATPPAESPAAPDGALGAPPLPAEPADGDEPDGEGDDPIGEGEAAPPFDAKEMG
jgi:hypothetical protein